MNKVVPFLLLSTFGLGPNAMNGLCSIWLWFVAEVVFDCILPV